MSISQKWAQHLFSHMKYLDPKWKIGCNSQQPDPISKIIGLLEQNHEDCKLTQLKQQLSKKWVWHPTSSKIGVEPISLLGLLRPK